MTLISTKQYYVADQQYTVYFTKTGKTKFNKAIPGSKPYSKDTENNSCLHTSVKKAESLNLTLNKIKIIESAMHMQTIAGTSDANFLFSWLNFHLKVGVASGASLKWPLG